MESNLENNLPSQRNTTIFFSLIGSIGSTGLVHPRISPYDLGFSYGISIENPSLNYQITSVNLFFV